MPQLSGVSACARARLRRTRDDPPLGIMFPLPSALASSCRPTVLLPLLRVLSQPKSVHQLAPQRFLPLQPTPAGFGAPTPAVMPQAPAMLSAQHHPAMQVLRSPPSVAYPSVSLGMAQYNPVHYAATPQPPIQHAPPPRHHAPPAPPTFHQAAIPPPPPPPPTILSATPGATQQHPVGQPMGVPPPAAREATPAYAHSPRMQQTPSRPSILVTFLPDLAIPVSF